MEQQSNPLTKPPKACPICSVAMQATETKERIVHRCENCGMILTIVLPVTKDNRPHQLADCYIVPGMIANSIITCSRCGYQATETMPTDACQFFYDCKGCGERLKPLQGDCCVFCSYGSLPCPPIQQNQSCCS